MAKNLSIDTVIEKNKLSSTVPFLVCLEIGVFDEAAGKVVEYIRVVNNNEDIRYQGDLYVAADFTLSVKSNSGELPQVTVGILDYKRIVQQRMQEYGGGVGFLVAIIVVNAANLDGEPEHIEFYKVVGASAKNYNVQWTLGAENPLTLRCPKRRQMRDRCSWRYKSPECGYKGNLVSCDLTLQGANGCAVHSNTARFGGFPGIRGGGATFG